MLTRLATICLHHRRWVIAAWVVLLVLGVVCAPALFARLTSEAGTVEGTESERAGQLLWDAAPSGEEVYAVLDDVSATDPSVRTSVETAAADVAGIRGVEEVLTPWTGLPAGAEPHAEAVAEDGRAIAVVVRFAPNETGYEAIDPAVAELRSIAPTVLVGGDELLDEEMNDQAAADLARAELISMPVVLVLLLVLFGGVAAASLPVVVAVVGVGATLGTLAAFSLVADVSVYSVNIVTMLGLGLAVDYALLLVSRFREERAHGDDVEAAVTATMATAGRTVAFSGATVAVSLAGLLVFPDDFLRSMGLASLIVVLLDMVAAITLIPALLGAFGSRIRPARARSHDRGLFHRVAVLVRARPVVVALACTALLALAATPFAGARFSDPDERSLPASSESRRLAELADSRFDRDDTDPLTLVSTSPWSASEQDSYVRELRDLDGVTGVEALDVPGMTVLEVAPEGEAQGATALRLVDEMRALDAPTAVQVTGDAAYLSDYQDALMDRLPWALAIIIVATFALLFAFTGSLVVPLKALVMNSLSLGASFGALVWVFQDGNLGWLVGTEALGSLSITTPVLVFAIAFGLSMDYEVFLLGRICETWRRTGDNDRAVAVGLQATGRIVTAAALLMVVVFGGFVAGGFSPVKQVGLGLALAVAVDATIVRMLLMPAVMTLMGRANWWAPAPLRRLHDRFGLVEEPTDVRKGDMPLSPGRPAPAEAGTDPRGRDVATRVASATSSRRT
jgi:RND superfamily putative drug exporter